MCEPDTFKPVFAIELDDRSHRRASRRDRDKFVDELCMGTGLTLVRIPAAMSYSAHAIYTQILAAFNKK